MRAVPAAGPLFVPAHAANEPPKDCALCPRLAAFRERARERIPGGHNKPVPSFGGSDARLLVVGLAPGLNGANRTGRPFTGDFAGELLYATLIAHGFAQGDYRARADDGLALVDARITNAVRCVPPENKPLPAEVATCRRFLAGEIESLPRLAAILCLGGVAHATLLALFGLRATDHPFAHGAEHALPHGLRLFDSYHCSRLNTNTGRLTAQMFDAVVARVRQRIDLTGAP